MTYTILLIVHFVGIIFGLGAATVSDVLFMTALKDEVIDEKEELLLQRASLVIWVGIVLLVGAGVGMFLMTKDAFLAQPRLMAHATIADVVILNGLFINFWLLKRLAVASREKEDNPKALPGYLKLRSIGFVSGAVSFTSWWSVFLLGITRRTGFPDLSYLQIMGAYLLLVALAIAGASLLGKVTWAMGQRGKE